MDIEWALHDGRFFIVQARPITTLRGWTPALEEWNDSLTGDYLWTCANVGEAVPDVMTPCTWSLIQVFVAKTMGPLVLIGLRYHPLGNIGGRFYMNVSLAMSASSKFGVGRKRFVAREIGIPVVVGCGNATMRLHTGAWVRVNGGQGMVEVLRAADAVTSTIRV